MIMPFVPAQCPNCGGVLKVDNTKEAYICEHCGTPFITEKAINNYSTNVANNTYISNATFVQENEIKKLFDAAKGYIKLDQIREAEKVYSKITQEYPQLFEGWYAIIELYIEKLKKAEHLYIETPFENRPRYQPDEAYKNARKLATLEQNRMIDSLLEEYTELYNADRKKVRKNIWFHSFFKLMEYMKRKNIGLIEPGCSVYPYTDSYTAGIVLERESLKLEIDIIRNPETYDTYLHDIYVYTITGYDPNTYSFTFAEQGECYSQHIGEYKNGSSKYEYRRSTIECDVKLFVEDYNSEDLISKYYSYPYPGFVPTARQAQFLCKCEHRGKTRTIFWTEESMSNIGVPRYYKILIVIAEDVMLLLVYTVRMIALRYGRLDDSVIMTWQKHGMEEPLFVHIMQLALLLLNSLETRIGLRICGKVFLIKW